MYDKRDDFDFQIVNFPYLDGGGGDGGDGEGGRGVLVEYPTVIIYRNYINSVRQSV